MNALDRIVLDPAVCHGKAHVRGTRMLASVVLNNLAAGLSVEEIAQSYPPLQTEDVRAAIAYGAELASERVVPTPRQVAA